MASLPEHIAKVGEKYGLRRSDLWDCRGKWIAYHSALERIAAEQKIEFDPPQIVQADAGNGVAALVVTGHFNGKSEWSIGEAAPGNNKNSYPWAMAEKRGKDRVILKLLGLHGEVYSEEEADDFKPGQQTANEPTDSMGDDIDPRTVRGGNRSAYAAKKDGDGTIVEEMEANATVEALEDWCKVNMRRIESLPVTWQNKFWPRYDDHRDSLKQKEAA